MEFYKNTKTVTGSKCSFVVKLIVTSCIACTNNETSPDAVTNVVSGCKYANGTNA
jgi:hypothetical protein